MIKRPYKQEGVKLNRLHQQRWDNARRLVTRMIERAAEKRAILMYHDSIIKPNQIVIDDCRIMVKTCATTTYIYFEADPDYDHGLYETCAQFKERLFEDFTLIKKLKW